MSDLLSELQDRIFIITLNRVEKHNAFDDRLLAALKQTLDEAVRDPRVRVILLKANGKHFLLARISPGCSAWQSIVRKRT